MDDKKILKDCCKIERNKTVNSISPSLRKIVCSKCGYIFSELTANYK